MLLARLLIFAVLLLVACSAVFAQTPDLPGALPLTGNDDLAKRMVEGIHAYLDRELAASAKGRSAYWHRDLADAARYEASVTPNRERLRQAIGLTDRRDPVHVRMEAGIQDRGFTASVAGRAPRYNVYRVRWNVFRGVEGEGLLIVPIGKVRADVVALPDCDASPEMLIGLTAGVRPEAQFARRLAESGCRVLIPALIDRAATYSDNPAIAMTNQPHREFLYRAAYEMGRTTAGYEVQKTLAAVDWFLGEGREAGKPARPVGIFGYGEGGLVALHAAAVDNRISAAVVSGYFAPRERMPGEPIYRSVFGLLREFGDAEIASLVAPRPLVVEASAGPIVSGPPETGRRTAASGILRQCPLTEVEGEVRRAAALTSGLPGSAAPLFVTAGLVPGTPAALEAFLSALDRQIKLATNGPAPRPMAAVFDTEVRRKRQFAQIAEDTQVLMRESPLRRKEFWSRADLSTSASAEKTTVAYRETFWNEILGRLPEPTLPPTPRARQIYDTPKFSGYEVTLDLYPDVFAYGILLVPKGIPTGERRAVVVCQHGLEGRPQDVANPAVDSPYYHRFACSLAEKGYITFAPQNPYIGEDRFRTALRKAQPLKLTLFSFIVRQHEALLKWLGGLPFADPARIAFYGLSYGGKTAMRVPAALPGYCLSICSGDYNEWVWKCSSMDSPYSYLFTNEYDMPEWNLANTFNYAEMSWLICPRPFMVERGHNDGVAPDDWVAYEYAHTRRVYDLMGLHDQTELEIFNGPHTIHGVGTFQFLDRHLK